MSDDMQPITGPQLSDFDLTEPTDDGLLTLALAVGMELGTCETMFDDGEIEREELRWVQSDAERVRNELMRREMWTSEGLLASLPNGIREALGKPPREEP